MKTLKLTVTTSDGEILDSQTIEVVDETRAIEYRPINTVMSGSGHYETLVTGKLN